MSKLYIPEGYSSALNLRQTEHAIKKVKDFFERDLAIQLNLMRVSAPLFVESDSGLNDTLSGVERPVSFDLGENGKNCDCYAIFAVFCVYWHSVTSFQAIFLMSHFHTTKR